MEEHKYHIFVIGYDDFNINQLKQLPLGAQVNYHAALSYEDIKSSEHVPALELFHRAESQILNSDFKPDAVITFWDFPATILAAMLAERFGLRSASVESIFKCENKRWSRTEQAKVIGEHIPCFAGFNPDDRDAFANIGLAPPFWIKPVKSFRSYLAFRVDSAADFEHHRQALTAGIDGIYKPFQELMVKSRLPGDIAGSELSCIAEAPLTGEMCTVEAYAFGDEVVCYGIVDSIREQHSNSFNRYQYPSKLPATVQQRMAELTRDVARQLDLRDACFNVEYFYNPADESVHLLEINPRTSQSHSWLFCMVDGVSQFRHQVDIALGRRPQVLPQQGEFAIAAKYMHRAFKSGVVTQVPDARRLAEISRVFAGTQIKLHVNAGDDLNELLFQDAYSFELADIYIGAADEAELEQRYRAIAAMLDIRIAPKQC
ncbi:ATP-grasp domain-containing protein [Thalassomonas actiniarum]|uniref:ATP-grasp domain-containing protein n=1 Tax=Thalassomonas actiniarum TaxID=485447 RepID=A0AAE9YQX0_9GAMM|nr:ATP-grasp domain-containing protein [Thalassomonas actiniarum]WDD99619.1 ATP-grasp domain-containing protein [Thalassomonas actiniarum]